MIVEDIHSREAWPAGLHVAELTLSSDACAFHSVSSAAISSTRRRSAKCPTWRRAPATPHSDVACVWSYRYRGRSLENYSRFPVKLSTNGRDNSIRIVEEETISGCAPFAALAMAPPLHQGHTNISCAFN